MERLNQLERARLLQDRSKKFAMAIVRTFTVLPRTAKARVIGRQFLHSGTSVAANYRAACRARSKAEFISKSGVVVEEADEMLFWLELLVDAEVVESAHDASLRQECDELLKIFSGFLRPRKPIAKSPTHSIAHPLTQCIALDQAERK